MGNRSVNVWKKKLDNDGKMVNTTAADWPVIKQAVVAIWKSWELCDIRPCVAYAVSELAKKANTLTSGWVALNSLSLEVNGSIPGLPPFLHMRVRMMQIA